ncbi:hypothetical protein BDQ17DRAFT_1366366 [Cyathus striatus]|nr:hypothetical protein BDQ17DRAFT_1366366 [Cyathus striatus]
MCAQPTNLASPIHNIPTDIFCKIFIESCKIDFDDRQHFTKQTTTPFTLGSVCRIWRDTAWSIPQLCRHPVQVDLLDIWLTNSKNCPTLSIYFDITYDRPGPALAVMEKLVGHSERWECADICRIPLLRVLYLGKVGGADSQYRPPLPPLDMFSIAPRLQTFSALMEIEISISSIIPLPWNLLTSFYSRIPMQESVEVLSLCPNLVKCHFDYGHTGLHDSSIPITIPPPNLMVMHHLTTLKIADAEHEDVVFLLNSLCCPALRELDLETMMESSMDIVNMNSEWSQVGDFLSRSACPLEILKLNGTTLPHAIVTALGHLPTLKVLSLHEYQYTEEVNDGILRSLFMEFNSIGAAQTFLPQLREIHFISDDTYDGKSYIPMLLSMLQKLWDRPSGSRLQIFSAELDFMEDIPRDCDTLKGFKELMSEGMQISIETNNGDLLDV